MFTESQSESPQSPKEMAEPVDCHPAPTAAPGSLRELLIVALPLMLSSGSLSLMMVVDRLFLTWLSENALAASLPASMLHWTLMSLAIGTAAYVNTFISQYDGAGRPDRVAASLWQGIYFTLLASVAMLAILPLGEFYIRNSGHPPEIQALEASYFRILSLGSIAFVLPVTLSCFYSGRGKTMLILGVNVTTCIVNIWLDYALIFGAFGFPAWGMDGAAWATVIGGSVGIPIYLAAMVLEPQSRAYQFWKFARPDFELFGRLLRYGLPGGIHMFLDVLCFTAFVHLVGTMGKEALAATNLAFNLNTLAFVPLMGMGTAIMTLVGRRIGEARPDLAKQTVWKAFWLSFVYMGAFSVFYLVAPDLILAPYRAYASSPEAFERTHEVVVVLLRFVAVYCVFDAMLIVFGSGLRGAGDVHFPLFASVITGWLVAVLPTYVAMTWFSGGILSAWTSVTVWIILLGLIFLARFEAGHWMRMSVIEKEIIAEHAHLVPPVEELVAAP